LIGGFTHAFFAQILANEMLQNQVGIFHVLDARAGHMHVPFHQFTHAPPIKTGHADRMRPALYGKFHCLYHIR